jgi:hypothetical protein
MEDASRQGGNGPFVEERRPPGLKPELILNPVRGPEGPLFHGDACILTGRRIHSDRVMQTF